MKKGAGPEGVVLFVLWRSSRGMRGLGTGIFLQAGIIIKVWDCIESRIKGWDIWGNLGRFNDFPCRRCFIALLTGWVED